MSPLDGYRPGLFAGLLDDAAIFPPGDLPLDQAVPAHLAHRQAAYGDLVGLFVVGAAALGDLGRVTCPLRPRALDVALTVPVTSLAAALAEAETVAAIRVLAVEVALPDGVSVDEAMALIGDRVDGPRIFVELPRDERRGRLLAALAHAGHAAKLRTGGVLAQAHPGEDELAGAVLAAVRAGVPFKATAGLHHAVRNTDRTTGFEQHGFLNVMVATGAALAGADRAEVSAILADRDADRVATRAAGLSPRVRGSFHSFGTCSIEEPVAELARLGMAVPA